VPLPNLGIGCQFRRGIPGRWELKVNPTLNDHHLLPFLTMVPPLIHFIVQLVTILGLGVLKGPYLLISKLISIVTTLTAITFLNGYDLILFLINLIVPRKRKGAVVAAGDPGYEGLWPEFQPPNPNFDSRSPCPYLSASDKLSRFVPAHPETVCLTFDVFRIGTCLDP